MHKSDAEHLCFAASRPDRGGEGDRDAGNKVEDMPPLVASLNEMRRAAGREHLPFEIVVILNDEWDVYAFRRAEDYGVTVIQLLPLFYHYQRRTSLDEKRRYLTSFAEKILRHFQ